MATFYINADSGNDTTGTGTASAPWLTFIKAHDEASDGDTIVAQASAATYTFATKTLSKSFTLKADKPGDAVFDAGGSAVRWFQNSSTLTNIVQNIWFQNGIPNATQDPIFCFAHPSGNNVSTWKFHGCKFDDFEITTTSVVSNGKRGGLIGARLQATYNSFLELRGCSISRITTWGSSPEKATLFGFDNFNTTIAQTSFDFNGVAISIPASGSTAISQIFSGRGGTAKIKQLKNIAVSTTDSTGYGYAFASDIITDACFHNITSVPSGTNIITDDPLFVDPDTGNLDLQHNGFPDSHADQVKSPCIDIGIQF